MTIDSSPPQDGNVIDGITGQTDVDYQQGLILEGYWKGFSDPESGIHHYRYAIANTCFTIDQLQFSRVGGVTIHRTTESSTARTLVAVAGTYYVTVVAYNNALEPSNVVCSDGVTIDVTPPELEQIEIQDLDSMRGLVREKGDTRLWLIDTERHRRQITGYDGVCFAKALEVQDVSVYPFVPTNGTTDSHALNVSVCPFSSSSLIFFTHVDEQLVASWKGGDNESGIDDFYVGMGRTPTETPPSVLSFRSTNQRSSINTKIPPLAQGEHQYVIVKATNRVGMETIKAVGPIIVDVSAPKFTGQLTVNRDVKTQTITVQWHRSDFRENAGPSSYLQYTLGAGAVIYLHCS